jgi:hypothetical protein
VNKGVDDEVFIRKPAPAGGPMFPGMDPGSRKKKAGGDEEK